MIDLPLVKLHVDGRLQLRHGPIDLLIEAIGPQAEVKAAYKQATSAFSTVLAELVSELNVLRTDSARNTTAVKGTVACNMVSATNAFSSHHFLTPMCAVAGAVADHVLNCMINGRDITKAYVNNGGDTALFLTREQSFSVGVCDNPLNGAIGSKAVITGCSNIRGVATSGWRGRSHSLGIADAVTVLASTAAIADAAATLIANAVNLPDHPMIERKVATELNPDSDLGVRLVTVDVGEITTVEADQALESGQKLAQLMIDNNLIIGVYGSLNSRVFSVGQITTETAGGRVEIDQYPQGALCA